MQTPVTLKLLELLELEREGLDVIDHDFDSPSWALKQAYITGQRQLIDKIKELISNG